MSSSQPIRTEHRNEIDLVTFVRVLWEHRLVIVIITGLFGLASIYQALTATHIFRAHAVVAKVSDANMSTAAPDYESVQLTV